MNPQSLSPPTLTGRKALLAAALSLAACASPTAADARLALKLVRGDSDPLRDPGSATRGASPVGSLRVDFTLDGVTESRTLSITGGATLELRVVPRDVFGTAKVQVLGLRSEDGLVYSAARTAPLTLDGGDGSATLFFGPADALTAVGPALPVGRSAVAVAGLGEGGALLVGGEAPSDGGVEAASPALLRFRSDEVRTCGVGEGCLSGEVPPPRRDAIAVSLADGRVLHGLGRTAGGAIDASLWVTDSSGATVRLTLAGDPVPAVWGAMASTLPDGTVVVLGGEGGSGPTDAIFHLDLAAMTCTRQTVVLKDARRFGGIARLSGGALLIAGGEGRLGPMDSVEVYTPNVGCARADGGAFSAVRRVLKAARVKPQLVRLPDDGVAIVGGGVAEPEVFRLDLGANVGGLVDLQAPPAALRQLTPAAARLGNGQVLSVGGEPAGQAPVAAAFVPERDQVLGPSKPVYAGTWRPVGASFSLRARPDLAVLADGSVLVVGGGLEGEPLTAGMSSAPRLELFVPAPAE